LADDALPRPLPLSRALRQPLPPRSAREVQGLGARGALVAGAPTRADGGLPRRLFRAASRAAGPRRRPLLALPALRAPRLGLLRHLGAGGVAEPAREREPDPQGALS